MQSSTRMSPQIDQSTVNGLVMEPHTGFGVSVPASRSLSRSRALRWRIILNLDLGALAASVRLRDRIMQAAALSQLGSQCH